MASTSLRFKAKFSGLKDLTVDCKTQQDLTFYYISNLISHHSYPSSCCFTDPLVHPLTRPATPEPSASNALPQNIPRSGSLTSFNVFIVRFPNRPNYNCKKLLSKYSFPLPYLSPPPNFNLYSILFTGFYVYF